MMDKRELIRQCSKNTEITQTLTQKILRAEWNLYKQQILNGEGIYIPEIGKITIEAKEGRNYKNPNTGELSHSKSKLVMKLHPSPILKKQINNIKDITE